MKVLLNIIDGPEKGKSFELKIGSYVVGRSQGEVRLADKKVSSRHCEIAISKSECWIEDLNSTNGTFIGGSQITEKKQVKNLDVLTIGLSRISVHFEDEINASDKEIENSGENEKKQDSSSSFETLHQPVNELPQPNAFYRETGVIRIDSLIENELDSNSHRDPSSTSDEPEPKTVPKIKVHLKARRAPDGLSEIFCSQAQTLIGRRDVDVRINDLDLSRKHCAIDIIAGTQAVIRDLGSTNGTYVNGKKISTQEIKNGDLIQIGQSLFEAQIIKS
jgi:pSer/pThr/pTyr-binding forkhead associated (FHA) protein